MLLNSMCLRILKGAGLSNVRNNSFLIISFFTKQTYIMSINPSEFLHTTSDFRNGLVRHPLGVCVREVFFSFFAT